MDNAKLKDLAERLVVKSEENRKLFENLQMPLMSEKLGKHLENILMLPQEALRKSFENLQINNIRWPIMPSLTKNLRYRCHCAPIGASSGGNSDVVPDTEVVPKTSNRKIGFQPPNI